MSQWKYKRHSCAVTALCIAALLDVCPEAKPKTVSRGRNESPLSLTASNVAGTSNIVGSAGFVTGYGGEGFFMLPVIGGKVGIAEILQLDGRMDLPLAQLTLGSMEGHMQITTPFNDKLRFFGIAVSADLFLSTVVDTISLTASEDKPRYNPYILATLISDLDWIALFPSVPLKTYLITGFADNPDILYRYKQLSVRYGAEWKMNLHSVFLSGGVGFYKEIANRVNNNVSDRGYPQILSWIEPGARYRIFNRISFLGGIRFPLYEKIKKVDPIAPEPIQVSLQAEMPVFQRNEYRGDTDAGVYGAAKRENHPDPGQAGPASTTRGGGKAQ
jgi:hypothetical protein